MDDDCTVIPPPETIQPPPAASITHYPNNASTVEDYIWHVNGVNQVRKDKKRGKIQLGEGNIFEKMYYRCSEK